MAPAPCAECERLRADLMRAVEDTAMADLPGSHREDDAWMAYSAHRATHIKEKK